MADRSRGATRRRLVRALVFLTLSFLLWRMVGPGLMIVRSDSLSPVLEVGDVVWIGRLRGEPRRGQVVTARATVRQSGFQPIQRLLELRSRLGGGPEPAGDRRPDGATESAAVPDRFVLRMIVAVPGDRVSWTDRTVSVRDADDTLHRYDARPIHPELRQPLRQRTVRTDEVFLLGLAPGLVDSRVLGPQPADTMRQSVRRILWPADRRGPIPLWSGSP